LENLGKTLFKNTLSNYIVLLWRMLTAIFITRMLFLNLGEMNYGFWALLWTVFGYSLLLDFGFGQSVQKYTAEAGLTGDMNKYSKLISTVTGTYLLMSLIIVILAGVLALFLEEIFSIGTDNLAYYKMVFFLFGVGTAFIFPSGIFAEILVGLKRTDLKNCVMFFNVTFQLAGIYLIFKLGYSLLTLALFSTILNLMTNLGMASIVFRIMPGFHLSVRKFSMELIKEIAGFSIFAYLITFAKMIIFRTDKIVLGIMLGMPAVSIYQLGSRISEIMEKLTVQFQENLGPVAASLYKAGDTERLKWVLLGSARITAFISTGVFLILYILSRQILFVWLRVESLEVALIACILVFSTYVIVLFRSAPEKFLLMAGRHKLLAAVGMIESIANIILSIYFVYLIGAVGVAVGTIIPSVIFSIFVILPASAKLSGLSIFFSMRKIYFPVWMIGIPSAIILILADHWIPLEEWNLIKLGFFAGTAGGIYLLTGMLFYITEDEKKKCFKILS
jgi:O-antigen/teichoic acid export membrane protein